MKKIEKIPVRNPFKVPDNYFEEVTHKLILVTTGNDKEIKRAGIYLKFRPFILAAASVAGFVILSYTVARLLTKERVTSVNEESLAVTLTEPYINDIDILTLEENAEAIELTEVLSGIRKSDIIDYLMLENIETDDIYEEL